MDICLMASDEGLRDRTAEPADNACDETLSRFDEFAEPLRRYLMCTGVSPPNADDTVQETFLRLYRHLKKNGLPSNVCGWIFQVAKNLLRDERRGIRRRSTTSLEDVRKRSGGPIDPRASPEQQLLSKELAQRLGIAVARLPEQQRECMMLRSSGLRYHEIAGVLGITPSGVGTLVHRAMLRLREELS